MNFPCFQLVPTLFKTAFLLLVGFFLLLPMNSFAEVSVDKGPTPIQSGDAVADSDVTLKNDHIAVSISSGTPAPWGVANGGILDGAVVEDGTPGVDRVTLVDFIPNNWSSWPTTYQEVSIPENTPDRGVVRTKRDWGECDLVTTYTLERGSDRIKMVTRIQNNGSEPTGDILSGYVLWATGGYHFGPPGIYETKKTDARGALSDWSVTYDKEWMAALHAPYFDHINYNGKDMYLENNLKPGEEKKYTGYLQMAPSGDLAPVLNAEMQRKNIQSGTISGAVKTASGENVEDPYVVVKKEGEPYTWAGGENGRFSMELPEGDYSMYATAAGYSASAEKSVEVKSGGKRAVNFNTLESPGVLNLQVRDGENNPADARISIEKGATPLIRFLGKKTFFTRLDQRGNAELTLAPGEYEFSVESGANFFANPEVLKADVQANREMEKSVEIEEMMSPPSGWLNCDMHHHSDQLDGKTSPEYLVRSQLAADVDFIFISDHDTVVNNGKTARLAKEAGLRIIPSIEISPSWGHFNAYPLASDATWDLNSGKATVAEIFEYARDKGAKIIQQNHPIIPYGYFKNADEDTINGKYRASFDLVELNSDAEYEDAWELAMSYWNQGDRYYLSAGTDVHDVRSRKSGEMRMFAYTRGSKGVNAFVDALKDGKSYASFGPMIVPHNFMFGDEIRLADDESTEVDFGLKSVNGLNKAVIYQNGEAVKTMDFENTPNTAEVSHDLAATGDGWMAIVVEDAEGRKAYSNPVWINITQNPKLTLSED